jgi:hypothetical protein
MASSSSSAGSSQRNYIADDSEGFPRSFDLSSDSSQIDQLAAAEPWRGPALPMFVKRLRSMRVSEKYVHAAVLMLNRDDFLDTDVLQSVLVEADRLRLDPHLLNQVNKSIWLDACKLFTHISQIRVSSPKLGHWMLFLRAHHPSHPDGQIVMAELLAEKGGKLKHLRRTLEVRNGGTVDDEESYIYPRLILPADLPTDDGHLGPWLSVERTAWKTFVVSCMLDEQAFKPYGQVINNCQQWVERIAERCQWALDATPFLSEASASGPRSTAPWCSLL